MKRLLIVFSAIIMSCTNVPSQKSSSMQNNAELLASESQGGTKQPGFRIIKDETDFRNVMKAGFQLVEEGKESSHSPEFPKNKKVIVYNLGSFRSGSHKISQIKSISVKNNVLYVEVPAGPPSGGMEIQMISNPWFMFAVPADFQFTSVELKYSK
ncbi:protease complex subunit PrcB family protein [Chryseobacterium indologenes]|uniref:protease complex subunit PrcB family protein n=2 Tax=Chryseobacterium indologenes TaxID=253 RepID=UPI000555B821|nr:protease complex subunit PrcB family protein [Chryseobacterium indologenes]QPQ50489.1 protease complex subunit PrcB family protein [Chryseobacterium indologenes]TLX25138.1 hypothetical protein FE904_12725 [Chryseobacterium indologenes]SFJ35362.1 hypothetical protein SAMN05421692_1713 [Chryseobacterium indologenes]SUX53146.1 Uncharacterised protein [Chryseobacterium indologenes]